MWIHTTAGFYSVVQKRGERLLTVRARDPQDLERLRTSLPSLGRIIDTPKGDYPYRAHATKRAWAAALATMGAAIDYPNFKDEVKKSLGPRRGHLLLKVWAALAEIEPPTLRHSRFRWLAKPGATRER